MTKVLIRNARAAFVELGDPDYFQSKKQHERDERKWTMSFICIPGVTEASLDTGKTWRPAKAVIDGAIRQTAVDGWGPKGEAYLEGILPDAKACAWQNGNRKPDCDGHPGNWVLAAKRRESEGRPLVYDGDRSCIYPTRGQKYFDTEGAQKVFEKDSNTPCPGMGGRLYSGCYVFGSVDIFKYDKPSKGIRCGLNGVRFMRDSDAFGGGSRPNPDDFGEIAEGAGADALV